jgi:ubiquinol-cytochrome c reductase cytochrome b subunit
MWLWGDYSVSQPILNRIFSLHFIIPLVLLVFVLAHILLLHRRGSSNPLGVETNFDKLKFFPYFLLKDFFSFFFLVLVIRLFIRGCPIVLGDPENFNLASIYTTPTHIKPE